MFILFKLLYTAETVDFMPKYISLGKARALLEWADELLGVDEVGGSVDTL